LTAEEKLSVPPVAGTVTVVDARPNDYIRGDGQKRTGRSAMPATQPLGRSDLLVPRLGVGAMTWGEAHGLARLHPAKIAYGGAEGRDEERGAWEASIAAGRPSSTRQQCTPVGRRSGGSANSPATKP
jgi:hypothetical protein